MQLRGKVAFITGGAGGLGGGLAEAFSECGMKLVLADIDEGRAEAKALRYGGDAIGVKLDVASLESWDVAREAALARFGRVDVLCNNAGVNAPRMPLEELPPSEFARVMSINVTGVYHGVVTFAPDMKARREGHIVSTSSMSGLLPFQSTAAYTASKFAIGGLSDTLRDELAPFGVGVTTLIAGLTRSRMSMEVFGVGPEVNVPPDLAARMMEPIWLGRAVVKAIRDNACYVITHPDSLPVLEERFANIRAAFGEPAQPGYRSGVSVTTGV